MNGDHRIVSIISEFILVYSSTQLNQTEFTTGALLVTSETCGISLDISCHIAQSAVASEAEMYMAVNFTDELRWDYFYETPLNVTTPEWHTVYLPFSNMYDCLL